MKVQPIAKQVLFVVGDDVPTGEDEMIRKRLDDLGCEVEVRNSIEADVSKWNEAEIAVVVIAPSAKASELKNRFREATVPVVVLTGTLFEEMRMTGPVDFYEYGQKSGELKVKIVNPNHPMAADLRDSVVLSKGPTTVAVGVLGSGAKRIAIVEDACKAVLFGYEDGDPMVGLNAPARRVGFFFNASALDFETQTGEKKQDYQYWRLFDAAIEWAVGQQSRQFADVFRAEWSEIQMRRQHHYSDVPSAGDEKLLTAPPANLVGLALSGGGIRAATFALGLLQGLRRQNLLGIFDYISTVSGGGYLGGWWSAWLRRNPDEQRGGHDIFPPPERIMSASDVLYNGQADTHVKVKKRRINREVAEDLLSAGNDPVHHLRLFANYLTPRKGALSSDTWRAAAVITRDLILTWVILLPLLIATILVGKIYFIVQHEAWDPNSASAFFFFNQLAPSHVLLARLLLIAWPLLAIVGLLGVLTCAWMLTGSSTAETHREWLAGKLGAFVVFILGLLIALAVAENFRRVAGTGIEVRTRWFVAWGIVALTMFLYVFWPRSQYASVEDAAATKRWQREVRRNLIVRLHAVLLVLLVVTACVLLLAGFGHEAVNYLFAPTKEGGSNIGSYVAKGGGWLAIIAAVAGSIFTAIKTSPAGGSDPREVSEPSLPSRLIFKFTPPLIIIVMAVTASWLANILLSYGNDVYILSSFLKNLEGVSDMVTAEQSTNFIQLLTVATCLGIVLSFYFALVETNWKYNWINHALLTLWGVLAALMLATLTGVVWTMVSATPFNPEATNLAAFADWLWPFSWFNIRLLQLVCYASAALLVFRLAGDEKRKVRSIFWPVVFSLAWIAVIEWIVRKFQLLYFDAPEDVRQAQMPAWIILFVVGSAVFCLLFVLAETIAGRRDNKRSLSLVAGVYVMLVTLFLLSLDADYTDVRLTRVQTELQSTQQVQLEETSKLALENSEQFTEKLSVQFASEAAFKRALDLYVRVINEQVLFGLLGALLTWVIAMGWMADPNALSMHTFYKSRLVRAYLGASNKHRSEQRKGITEAIEGDDVFLQDLQNCNRGAPYHLVNTTLNLVGGRDLSTAQRSAATFVLSKRYCGSSRTGYRDTREYMGGQLSLGTAVAVSGAAASPNMGAKTLTASLAMLMTFLNVRLGHWSPTPNKMDWRASKARLWPFYVMREFLSQTNDLSTYCYLTDGGHFDNTGLYSLVERGCRFIVATDCGADPRPCFQDVGDAMRRCRIDFDTEFDLDIAPFVRENKTDPSKQHFLVGTLRYSREHAVSLGWYNDNRRDPFAETDEEFRTGIIILFKPALTNKHESADVRQYGLENPVFPQQKTADQWYDEAQFESYRQLGQLCAELAFKKPEESEKERRRHELETGQSIDVAGYYQGKSTLADVKRLFERVREEYDPKFKPRAETNGHDGKSASTTQLQQMLQSNKNQSNT